MQHPIRGLATLSLAVCLIVDPAGSVAGKEVPLPGAACTADADCDDERYCSGAETCVDGACTPGADPCPGELCDESAGACSPDPCDYDSICDAGENCRICPTDCLSAGPSECGNGFCELVRGETCISCPRDCAGDYRGPAIGGYCCGKEGHSCDDARCNANGFRCGPRLPAPSCCGDGECTGIESASTCAVDCPKSTNSEAKPTAPKGD